MAEECTATAAADAAKEGEEEKENGKKDMAMAKVPFHGLFKYADSTDIVLMLVGLVGALGNGMSMVVMTIVFGQMIDAFGAATPETIVHRVNKVQPSTSHCLLARGVMLDDDWREAGYSYSIFISQISPETGYDILRCRNDDWTSSLQYII